MVTSVAAEGKITDRDGSLEDCGQPRKLRASRFVLCAPNLQPVVALAESPPAAVWCGDHEVEHARQRANMAGIRGVTTVDDIASPKARQHQSARDARADLLAGGLSAPAALDEAVGYHLRLAQEASFAAFEHRVGDPELKPGRYSILTLLAANPGATPTALARACGRDKSTLTAALRDLQGRGLIRREPLPGDQRSVRIHLTETGLDLLDRLRRHAEAHDRVLDRLVGAENKSGFIDTLRRIAVGLAEQGAAEGEI